MSYDPNVIDPNHPLEPSSFFHYMGSTGIDQPYFSGMPVATMEQFYQAIKARLVYELTGEGRLNPELDDDFLLNVTGGHGQDYGDDPLANPRQERRGRPRLTEEEKQKRADLRRLQKVDPVETKVEDGELAEAVEVVIDEQGLTRLDREQMEVSYGH